MTPLILEEVIRQIRELPSLPAVVLELLSSMEQQDIDVHVLAHKIELDQAMAAKTLRIANSSFYGMQSTVTSIAQAVSVLGFHSIRTVVTACALTGSFAPMSGVGCGFDFQGFWRHSLATAVVARLLAPHMGVNPETAFTAGLLHDLGTLVLATRFPDQHALVRSYRQHHDCQMVEAELAVLGIDHAQVGSALAAWWKFPAAIQQAVADQHAIARLDALGLPLLVHMANAIAHALDLAGIEAALVPPLSPAWRLVALDEAQWFALLRQAERTFDEMSRIMLA